ncbi:MAG: phosphate acetyltransferase [Clostridiales bacterium GWC2_40_7]|nr:MAG: phosphate acetyltransferase [Clostridiales bacterium GWC2_40_7]
MRFMDSIYQKARTGKKKIVLAEGTEERTLKAAEIIVTEGLADIVLLGDAKETMGKMNIPHHEHLDIIDYKKSNAFRSYVNEFYELRKNKGITFTDAEEIMKNPLYFGAMMVRMGDADGMVAGAESTSADLLRAAFQVVTSKPGILVVSSCFIFEFENNPYLKDGILFYADCVINLNPTAEQLAAIAVSTAETVKMLGGIEPRVAMLSFSTKGSAKHEMVDKVVDAFKIAKQMSPELQIDGEMQVDAAIVDFIGKMKCPDSPIAGKANVLIFPDLQSGNIAYKITERLAGAKVIGPVAQGFNKPVNDLSRGCSVEDIVNVVAITAVQAQNTSPAGV